MLIKEKSCVFEGINPFNIFTDMRYLVSLFIHSRSCIIQLFLLYLGRALPKLWSLCRHSTESRDGGQVFQQPAFSLLSIDSKVFFDTHICLFKSLGKLVFLRHCVLHFHLLPSSALNPSLAPAPLVRFATNGTSPSRGDRSDF